MGYDQPKPTRAFRMVATQPPLLECSGGLSEASGGFQRDSGGPLKELRTISKSSPSRKVSNVLRRLPEGFRRASGGSGGRKKQLRKYCKRTPEIHSGAYFCYSGMLRRGFRRLQRIVKKTPEHSGALRSTFIYNMWSCNPPRSNQIAQTKIFLVPWDDLYDT